MGDDQNACDLCGLPVRVSGFELAARAGIKRFCCEGCRQIYRMLHDEEPAEANGKSEQHASEQKWTE